MLFNSAEYWLFFAIVVAIFYALPFRYGKIFVLVASYYFYASWNVKLLSLILISTLVDYYLGLAIDGAPKERKKRLLIVSLIVNLGLLGFFKYYNFFASSFAAISGLSENSLTLRIVLPIGISFYTFASLSYTIDIYRGKIRANRSLTDYAFFIAFFPHLIAGPIIRAKQFLGQVIHWRAPSAETVQRGIILVLVGLIKKMVFADRFAVVSDNYFNHLADHPGWLAAWSGCFAFSMQLFFDFSGYTDIARGCAKLLGFEFPINFERPYLARNVVEFWQRWHITLSLWVRDYVFLPLTRGARGRFVIYRNLFATAVLVGLWHGASWNFVLWGSYMGVNLIAFRIFEQLSRRTPAEKFLQLRYIIPLLVGFSFTMRLIQAPLFRCPTLRDIRMAMPQMFNFGQRGNSLLTIDTIALFFVAFGFAILEERRQFFRRLAAAPAWIMIPCYAFAFFVIEIFAVIERKTQFIYFQF